MKKLVLVLLSVLSVSYSAYSQIEFGVKAGLSSYDLADKYLKWQNKDSNVSDNIQDASYGYHFGAYTRLKFLGLYIEPAVLFNSNTVSYKIDEVSTEVLDKIGKERYQNLNIPVLMGFKLWMIRVHGGPVAHIFINSSSELTKINGYMDKFKDATFGYQFGVGTDIGRLRLDINYEGNFSNWGKNMEIGGVSYNFDDKPARIVASVGMKF